MALQVLQGLSPSEDLRQRAGSDFAQNLGTGLRQLAQNKMNEVQQRKTQLGLQGLPGISPEQAQLLAQLPPELLQDYVKQQGLASTARKDAREDQIKKHYGPIIETNLQRKNLLKGIKNTIDNKDFSVYPGIGKVADTSQYLLNDLQKAFKGDADELLQLEMQAASRGQGGRLTESARKDIREAKVGLHLPKKEMMRRIDRKLKEIDDQENRLYNTYPTLKEYAGELTSDMASQTPQAKIDQADGLDEKTLKTYKGFGFQDALGNLYKWDNDKKEYVFEKNVRG